MIEIAVLMCALSADAEMRLVGNELQARTEVVTNAWQAVLYLPDDTGLDGADAASPLYPFVVATTLVGNELTLAAANPGGPIPAYEWTAIATVNLTGCGQVEFLPDLALMTSGIFDEIWPDTSPANLCSCLWDLDTDGAVGASDFLALLALWDYVYDVEQFLALLAAWGDCVARDGELTPLQQCLEAAIIACGEGHVCCFCIAKESCSFACEDSNGNCAPCAVCDPPKKSIAVPNAIVPMMDG